MPGLDGFGSNTATRPILLPNENAAWTYQKDIQDFNTVTGVGHLGDFWQRVLPTHPRLQDHPYKHLIDEMPDRVIPCRLFADDGQLGKHRSILVMHWCPVLCNMDGHVKTLNSRFPQIVQDEKYAIPKITERPLIDALVWSWHVIASGVWPEFDQNGKPLTGWRAKMACQAFCGGYRFVIFQLCNDWGYSAKVFFPSEWGNPSCEEICWWCKTCRSPGRLSFTN